MGGGGGGGENKTTWGSIKVGIILLTHTCSKHACQLTVLLLIE